MIWRYGVLGLLLLGLYRWATFFEPKKAEDVDCPFEDGGSPWEIVSVIGPVVCMIPIREAPWIALGGVLLTGLPWVWTLGKLALIGLGWLFIPPKEKHGQGH